MRRVLRSVYERRGTLMLTLAVVATALAIAALGLAGYALHQILTFRQEIHQDVWLVYSQNSSAYSPEPNFAAVGAMASALAAILLTLAVIFKRKGLRRRETFKISSEDDPGRRLQWRVTNAIR